MKLAIKSVTSAAPRFCQIPLNWVRRIITVFIFYHLAAILIAPNQESYLAEHLRPYFMKYWMVMEFGSEWNFFAPEPGPAPIFLKYEAYDRIGILLDSDQMPHYPDGYFFRDRQIRRLNIVRFLMRDDQKIYSIFVPWICRTHPNADYVKITKVMHKLPSVLEIQKNERGFYDEKDIKEYSMGDVTCEGRRE